jgi:hypothetical protein
MEPYRTLPEIRFSDLATLSSLSMFGKVPVVVVTTMILIVTFSMFHEDLREDFGVGAVILILGGAVFLEGLLRPLLLAIVGWNVYRALVRYYGEATAREVAHIYRKGGALADEHQLEVIARRNAEFPQA